MSLILLILFAAAVAVTAVIVLMLFAAMFEPIHNNSDDARLELDDYDLP